MTNVDHIKNLLCRVDISTGYSFCWREEDEIELIIEFRDGPLAGKDYKIDVKKKDFDTEKD